VERWWFPSERVVVVHIVHGAGSAERMATPFEHCLFARKAALHKRVTRRHRRCFVAECVVQERARFVDAKRRTLRLCDQRVYISRAKRGLCLRPKCLICGDDILASSARCRLTACLYGFNVTRNLNKATICLKKSFTCVFQ
jgi:hypothetical protein